MMNPTRDPTMLANPARISIADSDTRQVGVGVGVLPVAVPSVLAGLAGPSMNSMKDETCGTSV